MRYGFHWSSVLSHVQLQCILLPVLRNSNNFLTTCGQCLMMAGSPKMMMRVSERSCHSAFENQYFKKFNHQRFSKEKIFLGLYLEHYFLHSVFKYK